MARLVGVDVARGVAVLGMMTAHVGPEPGAGDRSWLADQALRLADGRPSALFVVLAGVSLALMSGGPVPTTPLTYARVRVLVRTVLLLVIGLGLVWLDTPVVVILPTYAVLFLLGVPALAWSRPVLVAAACAFALVGPIVRAELAGRVPGQVGDALVGPYYPAVVWAAYLLAGLAVGRTDLRAARVRPALAGIGAGLLALGYGGGALAQDLLPNHLTSTQPHASTTFEVAANTGVALLVLVGCLELGDRVPRLVAPVAAVGALALTAYVVHVVVIALVGPEVVYAPDTAAWLAFLAVTVLACWAWRTWLGRGPLERVLHGASAAVAARAVRAREVSPRA